MQVILIINIVHTNLIFCQWFLVTVPSHAMKPRSILEETEHILVCWSGRVSTSNTQPTHPGNQLFSRAFLGKCQKLHFTLEWLDQIPTIFRCYINLSSVIPSKNFANSIYWVTMRVRTESSNVLQYFNGTFTIGQLFRQTYKLGSCQFFFFFFKNFTTLTAPEKYSGDTLSR